MRLLKLRFSMTVTLALIIGLSTLFFALVMSLAGSFDMTTLVVMVVGFNLLQWLFAPWIIDKMYKTQEASVERHGWLREAVQRISRSMGIRAPRMMIADMPIANAFAYGSPLFGNRVAVTEGLLRDLEREEVEAVIGHELGHLKHRDVQVMMFVSVLPAIVYWVGLSFMFGGSRDRRGDDSGMAIVMIGSMVVYWVLSFAVLWLSRQREYYADYASATNVPDGARKLSEGLAKIVASSSKMRLSGADGQVRSLQGFKTLFIEDPDNALHDQASMVRAHMGRTDQQLVGDILSRKVSGAERLMEFFSTHPNIVRRLQALRNM